MPGFTRDRIARIIPARSKRASSWDRTGGNDDCERIEPGRTFVLADIPSAGCINHIYFTMILPNPLDYRDAVIRMYWDGEKSPSVEVPFGDFFCISSCTPRQFASLMVSVNPSCREEIIENGVNCYWPMPFAAGARITLTNESPRILGGGLGRIWYHIDYEVYDEPPPADLGRFHAQWRRECPTEAWNAPKNPDRGVFPGVNLSDAKNYHILEARGEGHVAGLFLQVNNIQGGWYGEGDDMIFIDDEPWPPSIHGTGTEEIFGGGACPNREYSGPYTGYLLVENRNGEMHGGLNAMYRWYLSDPIRFRKSLRMSIEHGHANDYANDYSSVAYWYQKEPHASFSALPAMAARRPKFDGSYFRPLILYGRVCRCLVDCQDRFFFGNEDPPGWFENFKNTVVSGYDSFTKGCHAEAEKRMEAALAIAEGHGCLVPEGR